LLGTHPGYFPTWKKLPVPFEEGSDWAQIRLDAWTKRKVFASASNATLIMGRLVDISMWTELPVFHGEYIPYKNVLYFQNHKFYSVLKFW